MKDETAGIAIKEFVGLKPKIYSFFLEDNNKCIRYSRNKIYSKDHRMETFEINKISLFCFDDKIYIQSHGYDGLALGYYN